MADGLEVHAGALATCAAELSALQDQAGRIVALGNTADPGFLTLGIFGELLSGIYSGTLHDVQDHLALTRDGLGRIADALTDTAHTYGASDATNEQNFDSIGAGAPSTAAGSLVSVGGHDVVRLDPSSDIPLASSVSSVARSVSAAVDDGPTQAEIGGLISGIGDLGGQAGGIMVDPLDYLISAGLSFLIDVVQPLEDLLALVTGNPEATAAQAETWRQVARDLQALGEAVAGSGDRNLSSWTGAAGDAARHTIGTFAGGVQLAAVEVNHLADALDLLKSLMEIAEAVVISLISAFIEWLVMTWVAAIALEIPSAGSSTVAATLATEAEAGVAVSRGASIMDRVAVLTERIGNVFGKLKLQDLKSLYEKNLAGLSHPAGSAAPGFKTLPRTLVESGLDWRVVGLAQGFRGIGAEVSYGGSGSPSAEDIEKALRGA